MIGNKYFKIAGSLLNEKNNLDNSTNNIFNQLFNNNSYINDLNVLNEFISFKKNNNFNASSFLYSYSLANVIEDISIQEFRNNMCNILNMDEFDISGNKMAVNGFVNLNQYDYRITFSNSKNISFSDMQYLINAFNLNAKSNGIDYGLKFEPNATDLMIIYLREENLELAVNILENLKRTDIKFNEIVNRLGSQKPFTSSVSGNSFYGVSMGTSRLVPSNLRGFFAIGKTYTEYIGDLMDKAYTSLLNKYGVNEKITSVELYDIMSLIHKNNYGFSHFENIPLWMNRDNYENYCKKNIYENEKIK